MSQEAAPTPTPTPTPSSSLLDELVGDIRETTATPEPTGTPSGDFESTCDYLLDFDNGHEFVADAFITDTGGIAFEAEVEATWRQAGGDHIVKTKKVTVPAGAEDYEVSFKAKATNRQIDRIQALDTDKQCKVEVTITGYAD